MVVPFSTKLQVKDGLTDDTAVKLNSGAEVCVELLAGALSVIAIVAIRPPVPFTPLVLVPVPLRPPTPQDTSAVPVNVLPLAARPTNPPPPPPPPPADALLPALPPLPPRAMSVPAPLRFVA
ncbi:Uncharacterised protein [uncultured archaeon]|nr:Uncharacterised protein [uncultured archaeon]